MDADATRVQRALLGHRQALDPDRVVGVAMAVIAAVVVVLLTTGVI